MIRPALEVADVFRQFGPQFVARFGASLSREQKKVIQDIELCRTAALGGHKEECDGCSYESYAFNSCRNRHCPKCQGTARAKWMSRRVDELLPVSYFHLVFTLPQIISRLALQNKKVMYDILFQATSRTLLEIAASPKHLGARLGFFAVLHTWGQRLQHHPHLHCVIPAGGPSLDGQRWIHCQRSRTSNKQFFLSVNVLSRKFVGKYIALLRRAYADGKLSFFGDFESLKRPDEFERFLDAAVTHKWVVYAKRPFGSETQLVSYLARYTHRVAITNTRLLRIENGRVFFRWKDYRNGCVWRTTSLDGVTFIRKFLQHVVPTKFFRIRHFGIFCNRFRTKSLDLCRQLLGVIRQEKPEDDQSKNDHHDVDAGNDGSKQCPVCKSGRMRITETWEVGEKGSITTSFHLAFVVPVFDTS